ncbi:hypothetical protein K432DRAFT_36512 [Lepidopterella palustris CBS 459.81]|uniref:DUF7514 domain-containing protein n=1 Tax=Lepidopterella palustris CBS 459.81 TaxID=1314670 RepID=A0A8E2EB63_9PEZI|nr:hypothetical protein K432DRAFT_36512 [Lepidopterella palustris CBS 459.81]
MQLEEDGSRIPLLTRLGFMYWVCYQLLVAPEATLKSLNKLLAEAEQPLKNQKLDKPFTYTTIPNECLPKVQQGTIDNIIRVSEAWNVSRTKIIDKHKEEARQRRPGPYSRAAQKAVEDAKKAVEVAKDQLDTSGTSKVSAANRLRALTNTDSQRHPRTTSPQLNEQQQHLLAQQQQMAMYQQMSLLQQQRAAEFAIQMRLQQAEYASMQNAANSLLYSTVLQSQTSANAFAIQSWGIF